MRDFSQLGSCVAQPKPAASREAGWSRAERLRALRLRAARPSGPPALEVLRGLPVPTLGTPECRVLGPRPIEARGWGSAWGRERLLGLQLAHLDNPARDRRASSGGQGGAEGYSPEISVPLSGERVVNQTNRSCRGTVEERLRAVGKGDSEFCAKPGLLETLAAPAPVPASKVCPGLWAPGTRDVEEGQ